MRHSLSIAAAISLCASSLAAQRGTDTPSHERIFVAREFVSTPIPRVS